MELITASEMTILSNPGKTSRQLLFPENSSSKRITLTHVVMQPGAINAPHRHPASEQVWVAIRGAGHLLLEAGQKLVFSAGDVARFDDNELHGFENTGTSEFEYRHPQKDASARCGGCGNAGYAGLWIVTSAILCGCVEALMLRAQDCAPCCTPSAA